jgi:hypothetical protein
MKHKHLTLLSTILFAFIFNLSFAGDVDLKTAKNVGLNAYRENFLTVQEKDAGNIFISEEFTISEDSRAVYYVFNTSNMGFVIVAAEDNVYPILGYSFESFYKTDNPSPEFEYWMSLYEKQIISARELKLAATTEIEQAWNKYNVSPESFSPVKGTKDVTPLLTSTWNQDCCYNTLCPADAAATAACGHTYVGCVATSMAQVMYYWRYPATGQSSNSYYAYGYGTLSANFGATNYDWNAMTDACSTSNTAIATLSYHCGVAVDMNYGTDGSSANTGTWVSALPSYFRYSNSIQYDYMDDFSTSTWEGMIRAQLDAKKPIVYTGFEAGGSGHAWNCDGYQGTNYFHFNWGWGGYYNAYFYLNNLNPGTYNFSDMQSMVYDIYPGSGYPANCTTNSGTLTSTVGTLVDGSGTSDYQNNADCSWLISPTTPIDHLYITFLALNTEATYDKVTIYDGPSTSDPVLGTYSGSTLPSQITSTSPQVLVRFQTNGSTTGAGWYLSYFSAFQIYCTGTTIFTDAAGSFEDGSGANQYNNSSNCKWDITPTGAGTVTLHFNNFSLEATNDKVRITDIVNGTLLGNYSGTTVPADVTCPSGQMRVIFTSNSSVTDAGFSATYSSTPAGISDYSIMNNLNVYPNPASDVLHISFELYNASEATIRITDLRGQLVYEEIINSQVYNKDIDMATVAKGVYSLQIITPGETVNKKVVIE